MEIDTAFMLFCLYFCRTEITIILLLFSGEKNVIYDITVLCINFIIESYQMSWMNTRKGKTVNNIEDIR
jgi:hypothetical protein